MNVDAVEAQQCAQQELTARRSDDPIVESTSHLAVFGANSVWLLLDRGALRIATILCGLVLIRYLGPSDYGLYAMAIATGAMVNIVTDLGLTRYGARASAANPLEIPAILGLSVAVTVASLVVEVAVFVASTSTGHRIPAAIAAGLMLTNLEGTLTLCACLLTGALRCKSILPTSMLSAVGTVAVVVCAVWLHIRVANILALLAVKSAGVLAVRVLQMYEWWPRVDAIHARELWLLVRRAWPYFSYAAAETGYSQLPILCLSVVATKAQVGIFAAALVIANIVPQWLFATTDALLPIITRLFERGDMAAANRLMQELVDLFITITIPASMLISILSPLTGRLLGARFGSSAHVLAPAAYLCVLTAMGALLGSVFLTAADRVRQRRNIFIVNVGLSSLLVLGLGSIYGGMGAVAGMLVGNTLLDAAYLWACRKAGLRLRAAATLRAVVAGVGACALAWVADRTFHQPIETAGLSLVAFCVLLVCLSPRSTGAIAGTLRACATGNGASL